MGDRSTEELTVAEFDRLSRDEQRREIAKYWAKLDALAWAYPDSPIICLLDPNDPAWLKLVFDAEQDKDG